MENLEVEESIGVDRFFRCSRVLGTFGALESSLNQLRANADVFQSTGLRSHLCFSLDLPLHRNRYFLMVPSCQEKIFFANQTFWIISGKTDFGNYDSHCSSSNLPNVSILRFPVPHILLLVLRLFGNVCNSKLGYVWRSVSSQTTGTARFTL